MKKIVAMSLAICALTAANTNAQEETAPAEPPTVKSVVELQDNTPTVATPDTAEIVEAPSVDDVMKTEADQNNDVGQASRIANTAGQGCGCQQTSYTQVPTYNTAGTFRVFPRSMRVAPIYTSQPAFAPMRRPLLRGRLFGGWRYR